MALLASSLGLSTAVAAQPVCGPARAAVAGATVEVCTLNLTGSVEQRVLLVTPPAPRAVLVMFPGGAGRLGLSADGSIAHGANILVRSRAQWAERGFAVVIPDAPSDVATLRGLRSSGAFARRSQLLFAFAKGQVAAPLFAVGTSQGTIGATGAVAAAPPGEVAGLVLLESISVRGGSRETVFDAQPQAVRVPVLVVANGADACPVTPPGDAPRIAASFSHAPRVDLARLPADGGPPLLSPAGASSRGSGGDGEKEAPASPAGWSPQAEAPGASHRTAQDRRRVAEACSSLSPHGYLGRESELLDVVSAWIDARLAEAAR